jgi:hypothetical protein
MTTKMTTTTPTTTTEACRAGRRSTVDDELNDRLDMSANFDEVEEIVERRPRLVRWADDRGRFALPYGVHVRARSGHGPIFGGAVAGGAPKKKAGLVRDGLLSIHCGLSLSWGVPGRVPILGRAAQPRVADGAR